MASASFSADYTLLAIQSAAHTRTTPAGARSYDRMDAIRSDIPARLDRLPWSAWHWRMVIALGVSWLLDGL
jgi:hypothetical protein